MSNGAVVAIGMATGILTARLLLPEGRGQLAVVLFWPNFFMGIGFLGLREAVIHRLSTDKGESAQVLASAWWLALGYALLTYMVIYLLMPILLGENREELTGFARTYAALFLLSGFTVQFLFSIDQGRMNFGMYNLLRVLMPVTYLSGLCVLWAQGGFSVEHVALANLVSVMVVAAVRLALAPKGLFSAPALKEMKALLVSGSRFYGTLLIIIVGGQADRLVLVSTWDNVSIGLYTVALTVASSGLYGLASGYETLIFPKMGRIEGAEAQCAFLARHLRIAMMLLTFLAVGLIGISYWMIPLIFGVEFAAASGLAVVLILAFVPYCLRQIGIAALRGLGEAAQSTVSETVNLATFLITVWPLAYYMGLMGMALAMLAGNVSALVYLFRHLQRRLGLNFRDWWGLNMSTVWDLVRTGRTYVVQR